MQNAILNICVRCEEQHESDHVFPTTQIGNRKLQCQDPWKPSVTPFFPLCFVFSMKAAFRILYFFPCFITSLWSPKYDIVCFACFWTSYKWNHIQYIFSTCSFHSALSSRSFSALYQVVWIRRYYLSILVPTDFWIVARSLLFQMLFLWTFSYVSPGIQAHF